MVIIGICGFQGVGKDTFSNYLVDNFGFKKFSFAAATKDILAIMFGWDRSLLEGDTIESRTFRETLDPWWSEKLSIPNLTPRKILQMVGTDLFRKHFDDEIWVHIVEKKIIELLKKNSSEKIIVSDCRFPNEIDMLKKLDGKIIHIQRNLPEWFNNYKGGNNCIEASNLHVSETAWIRENFNYTVLNEFDSVCEFELHINTFLFDNFAIENKNSKSHKDYLYEQFGLNKFTEQHKSKIEWINSNLIDTIEFERGFDSFDQNNLSQYYLYTGRGPSQNTLHIGHLLGLELILALSKQFESKIFFMLADDEKILRDSIDSKKMESNIINTIEQLNKIGFVNSNTKFHINSKDIGPNEYQMMIKLMSIVTLEQLTNIFGKKDNIGEYFYVFYQLVPCFLSQDSQCLVICGIDQDPFFRLARFLAKKIGYKPPIVLYTKSVQGLDGSEKMSTSNISSCPIFLSDNPEIIKNKIFGIKKVGAGSLDELFEKGANIESDSLIQLARLFETNKDLLDLVEQGYSVGFNLLISDTNKIDTIKQFIPEKGIVSRNNKMMITTFGVRCYLTNLIIQICSKYTNKLF